MGFQKWFSLPLRQSLARETFPAPQRGDGGQQLCYWGIAETAAGAAEHTCAFRQVRRPPRGLLLHPDDILERATLRQPVTSGEAPYGNILEDSGRGSRE